MRRKRKDIFKGDMTRGIDYIRGLIIAKVGILSGFVT